MENQPPARPEPGTGRSADPLTVDQLLEVFYVNLYEKAVAFMGLSPHPETKAIHEDLAQAKRAIDTMDFLFAQIRERMEWKDRIQSETLLTSLHLTYTKKAAPSSSDNSAPSSPSA